MPESEPKPLTTGSWWACHIHQDTTERKHFSFTVPSKNLGHALSHHCEICYHESSMAFSCAFSLLPRILVFLCDISEICYRYTHCLNFLAKIQTQYYVQHSWAGLYVDHSSWSWTLGIFRLLQDEHVLLRCVSLLGQHGRHLPGRWDDLNDKAFWAYRRLWALAAFAYVR